MSELDRLVKLFAADNWFDAMPGELQSAILKEKWHLENADRMHAFELSRKFHLYSARMHYKDIHDQLFRCVTQELLFYNTALAPRSISDQVTINLIESFGVKARTALIRSSWDFNKVGWGMAPGPGKIMQLRRWLCKSKKKEFSGRLVLQLYGA